MRKLSIALLAAMIAMLSALIGCGGGGGGGGSSSSTPPASSTFTVTGTVVDSSTGVGVGGVVIGFGTDLSRTAVSKSDGTFSLDTKATSAVAAYTGWQGMWPPTFTVSTAQLPQPQSGQPDEKIYPSTYAVRFNSNNYPQEAVVVPDSVLSGSTSSLGTIGVNNFKQIPPVPY